MTVKLLCIVAAVVLTTVQAYADYLQYTVFLGNQPSTPVCRAMVTTPV